MSGRNCLILGGKNLNLENWKVYHPNGSHMFTCGEDRIKWYINRGLGDVINDFEFKFTFEPKAMNSEFDDFCRSARYNRCVVTGVEERLQRHHIVPYCYRIYFDEEYKSKNHHDVVLIDCDKHAEYEKKAMLFRDVIAEKYGVKTMGEYNSEYVKALRKVNSCNSKIIHLISLLLKKNKQLTLLEKKELLYKISDLTDIDYEFLLTINYIQLYKLLQLIKAYNRKNNYDYRHENKKYFDHCYYVVKQLDTDEKLSEFVKLWRNHFIETMNPQFMPDGWSVDYTIKRNL